MEILLFLVRDGEWGQWMPFAHRKWQRNNFDFLKNVFMNSSELFVVISKNN